MKTEYKVYYSGKDFMGEGFYNFDYGTLKILKGSKIVRNESNSFRKYYQFSARIKDELIDEGIIVDHQFTKDHRFDKPFHASSILSSYGTAGNKAWKTIEGKTIDELIEFRENMEQFKEYYANYKFDEDSKEVQATIDQFTEKFPLEELPNLKIEEYDKIDSKETLAYAIEYGTDRIFKGVLGKNRNKIMFNDTENEYDCIDFLKSKYPQHNVEEMYQLYMDSLYKLITEFDKASYSKGEIDALPENTNIIRSKLLMLYRPKELLHIGSMKWFNDLFDYFGLDHSDMDSVMMNIQLKEFMNEIGIKGTNLELSEAITDFYQEEIAASVVTTPPNNFQDLFLEDPFIEEIVRVLKRKKAVIFKGVPGVGKTFVIRDIIRNSFDNIGEDGIEMIQFHQSYSYEEFVEGLRPQMDGGFNIEKGIFYTLCEKAKGNPESNYFLVIDEINRGNMSEIFGELLMLIENDKRDEYFVKLPYSKEDFNVPSNLYIIGTMNTADRSLALVDYAMRRRFPFVTLEPAYDTDKFNRYLKDKMGLKPAFISSLNQMMIHVNKIIEDRLGKDFLIGHSYFIEEPENIVNTDEWFAEVAKYEIMPMVEEYFFEDMDSTKEIENILSGIHEPNTDRKYIL